MVVPELEPLKVKKMEAAPIEEKPPSPTYDVAHLVDSIVCAAAESIDGSPRAIRPAVKAAFDRAAALGLGLELVCRTLAVATEKPKE